MLSVKVLFLHCASSFVQVVAVAPRSSLSQETLQYMFNDGAFGNLVAIGSFQCFRAPAPVEDPRFFHPDFESDEYIEDDGPPFWRRYSTDCAMDHV
ncbi:hypothetical protein ACHAXH_009727 [Discostella pseudostelligera]